MGNKKIKLINILKKLKDKKVNGDLVLFFKIHSYKRKNTSVKKNKNKLTDKTSEIFNSLISKKIRIK